MLSAWISLDASNQNTTFNGSAQTNDLELKFNGIVQNGYSINVSGTDIDIKTCLDYVPTRFLSSIQSYHFDGIADLNINIENQKSNKFPAAIQADFDIENASMKSNLPWQIKKLPKFKALSTTEKIEMKKAVLLFCNQSIAK